MYKLLDETANDCQLVMLTSEDYYGIIYTYGRVRLIEEDDLLRIQFEYEIHENPKGELDEKTFRNHIGDILVELIDQGVMNNSLTYTGGIDEN